MQEKKLQRLGGKKDINVDVRIITTSNADLSDVLKAGRFRSDLFHRLNEYPICLPPLRERKEDIPRLMNRFLEEARREFGKNVKGFSSEATKALFVYHWPGNVRELRNIVRRATLLAKSEKIDETHLLLDTASGPRSGLSNLPEKLDMLAELKKGYSLHEIAKNEIDIIEENIIAQVLSLTGGNKSKAAKMLKIDRMTLYDRINKYGLKG